MAKSRAELPETCEPVILSGGGNVVIRASGAPCKAVKDAIDGYGQSESPKAEAAPERGD